MSSTQSPSSPVPHDAEEPRKKGARGGKRSVTHLSKAQLARKRANDREAQRNIRQRTKEHIENLEKKVKELEGGGRSSSMERVLRRNHQLEEEVERLKNQLAQQTVSELSTESTPDLSDELLAPQKIPQTWMPVSVPVSDQWPTTTLPAPIPPMIPTDILLLNRSFSEAQAYPASSRNYGEAEASPQIYTPAATPIWDDTLVLNSNVNKSPAAWTPFHPELARPARFSDIQSAAGFTEVVNNPSYATTNCWQSQPSVYAWQISTKLKAPVTHVDHLMINVIQSQRHLLATSDLSNEDIVGTSLPSVHIFFNEPGPAKSCSTLSEVMNGYAEVLSTRGFALIPEKLASFSCMYRFVQWQISPTYKTYQALHDWQAPRPAQLLIPHPAWMDLAPWPKFRERLIENQELYSTPQFQIDYAINININFPFDIMRSIEFDGGQIKVSKLLDNHLSNLSNLSMRKPFADKYPEFRDLCRFDEV